MYRRKTSFLFLVFTLGATSACAQLPSLDVRTDACGNITAGGTITPCDAAAGLKDALVQGSRQAVSRLGRKDGFMAQPQVRIPVPDSLRTVEQGLRRLGQNKAADEFILSMNRAAEKAVPLAIDVLVDSVRKMSFDDAMGIVRGPDNAATEYFRRSTDAQLFSKFRPVVKSATAGVGATRAYKKFMDDARPVLALVRVQAVDLDDYVTRRALDGLYRFIAEEEKRIRENPVARTTELMKRVFASR
jgi:hypothetical protein